MQRIVRPHSTQVEDDQTQVIRDVLQIVLSAIDVRVLRNDPAIAL